MSAGTGRPALPPRLEGRVLAVTRVLWLMAVLGVTAFVAVGFVRAFADPQLVALPALTDLFVELGLGLHLMLVLALVLPFATVVAICVVVLVRRPDDPMALLFSLALLLLYAFVSRTGLTFADDAFLRHGVSVLFAAAFVCLALVLALFPDGIWAPPWSRWLAAGAVLLVVLAPDGGRLLMALINGEVPVNGPLRALVAGWCGAFLLGVFAQVHRWRHVSGPVARQQTKWVLAPLGAALGLMTVTLILIVARPEGPDRAIGAVLFLQVPMGILLPVMVANAVLRHRLFEIDRIISRTVSYATVTLVLVALYASLVVGLGSAVRLATGGTGGDLVIAVSTLAVAAVFRPVRARVQRLVDRRFDRTRYDAQHTVEAFGHQLRDEVDLETLTGELARIAAAAVRPTHASLWLTGRGPGPSRSGHGQAGSGTRARPGGA